jgi:glycosyltransferase involved in cell wall biosynthesis
MASLLTKKADIAPEKISVLPDAVDLRFMRSKPSDGFVNGFLERFDGLGDRPRVTFIGRLVPQKGVLHLVKAFSQLRLSGAKVSLVIAGDGPQYNEIRSTVTKLELDKCTVFTRFLHHDDIPLLLSETDVLVVPSLCEEFGSVLLEGMAAGVPIVASDVDGIPFTIQHERNGLLIHPGNENDLTAAIRRLLWDRTLAHDLARQALKDVERFDIERIAKALLNHVYLNCLQR